MIQTDINMDRLTKKVGKLNMGCNKIIGMYIQQKKEYLGLVIIIKYNLKKVRNV